MRTMLLATAVLCFGAITSTSAAALDCADADPSRETARVHGDFEFNLDPDDPAHNLIYVNHSHNGRSNVVVARVDGATGLIEKGTLTEVADNFDGTRSINGPEFVRPPGLGLGLLYRGRDGVHGIFRPAAPKAWNDFSLDIASNPTNGSPPALPSTYKGAYDGGGLSLDQFTYALAGAPCDARCYADMRSGVPTDLAKLIKPQGLSLPSFESANQGTQDGTIDFVACTKGRAVNGTCGIYEATIDKAGGFLAGSMHFLSSVAPHRANAPGTVPISAAVHPTTGTAILFYGASHEGGQAIDVYEQKAPGSLTLVGSTPVASSEHYRIVSNGVDLVLHYLIKDGNQRGSYAVKVTASGGSLQVGASQKITSASGGAEVEYLPSAERYAIWYQTSVAPSRLTRCFFDP